MVKQFVIFELKMQKFAIEIESVNEITNATSITPIPNSNRLIEGVVNLRGKVIPLINLSKVFGREKAVEEMHQIIIVNTDKSQVGLIIDSARDVKTFEENMIENISDVLSINGGIITGTINYSNEIIQVISIKNILAHCDLNYLATSIPLT